MINRNRRRRVKAAVVQQLNHMHRRTRGLGEIAVVVLDRKFSKMLPDQRSDIKLSAPESKIDSIGFLCKGVRCSVIVRPGTNKTSLEFIWKVRDGEFLLSRSSDNIDEVIEGVGKALGASWDNIDAALKG